MEEVAEARGPGPPRSGILDAGRPGGFGHAEGHGDEQGVLGEVGPLGGQRSRSPIEPPPFMQAGREEGTAIGEGQEAPFAGSGFGARMPSPSGRQVDPLGPPAEHPVEEGVLVVEDAESGGLFERNPFSRSGAAKSDQQLFPPRTEFFGRGNQEGALAGCGLPQQSADQARRRVADALQDEEVAGGQGVVPAGLSGHRHHLVEGGVPEQPLEGHLLSGPGVRPWTRTMRTRSATV